MKFSKYIFILLILFSVSCVRYSFKGALPSYLKNLYIEDFENQTEYAMVREEFMNKITEAFRQDNSLNIIEDRDAADLILKGSISSIEKKTVSFTQEEQTQQYQMVVTVKAECINTHTDKPLWNKSLSRYGLIPGTALRSDIDQAITQALDQIVDDVITETIAAW